MLTDVSVINDLMVCVHRAGTNPLWREQTAGMFVCARVRSCYYNIFLLVQSTTFRTIVTQLGGPYDFLVNPSTLDFGFRGLCDLIIKFVFYIVSK